MNRSIKMKPNEANEDNKEKVWFTLYGDNFSTVPKTNQGILLVILLELKSIIQRLGLSKDTL